MAEQRYRAVLAVISEGRTITEVAAEWAVSRQSLLNRPGSGRGIDPTEGGVMLTPRKYPDEVKDRSIRLVEDLLADPDLGLSVTDACSRVSQQLGINRDTLRGWVKQA